MLPWKCELLVKRVLQAYAFGVRALHLTFHHALLCSRVGRIRSHNSLTARSSSTLAVTAFASAPTWFTTVASYYPFSRAFLWMVWKFDIVSLYRLVAYFHRPSFTSTSRRVFS